MSTETSVETKPLLAAGKPPKRVLFFGKNMSRSRCTSGLVEALRAHDLHVRWLNRATLRRWIGERGADSWIRRVMNSYQPDVVFVFWRDLPLPLLREFKERAVTVLWVEESLAIMGESEISYLATPHVVAMSNLGHIEMLREHGVHNAVFLKAAFSPTVHHPVAPRGERWDVAYIGGPGRRGQRAELLAQVSRHFDTRVFGRGWRNYQPRPLELRVGGVVFPRKYRRICANARIVLGLNEVNRVPYYSSNRVFLTLGCGAFHLTHYVPGLEEVFQDGVHLAYFRSTEECLEKVEFYLRNERLRREIAARGHELALREHRYFDRIGNILTTLREGLAADAVTEPSLVRARRLVAGHRLSQTPFSWSSCG
jgi:spore maturation protein CgeB